MYIEVVVLRVNFWMLFISNKNGENLNILFFIYYKIIVNEKELVMVIFYCY